MAALSSKGDCQRQRTWGNFLGQLGAHGSAYFGYVNLVADCGTCEVRVFCKRLLRVVGGAIKVGHERADNEETANVRGLHGFNRGRRNLLVVHGLTAPGGFTLLLFPRVELGNTAVVVMAQRRK
jgi:hypothetical protein